LHKNTLIKLIKASAKKITCDLVIKNVRIIDVFNKTTFVDSVGVKDGFIIGIGNYEATETIDGTGKYICPGLTDAHCHIESSTVTPDEYYKVALLNGITCVIADPHEIANVLGTSGIKFMIDSCKNIPFDAYFMLPSCVPGTSFENNGASLSACDLSQFYKNDRILGLGEVMDFVSVVNCNNPMVDKLYDAIKHKKVIDGHCAGLSEDIINIYATAQILTDHECINKDEALERICRGMYVLIREGTAAKNLKDVLPAITESNSSRFCLCTDDKHIDDMFFNGSINTSIVSCINEGLKAELAISMATLNPATLYKLQNRGAIAPGYIADFLLLDDLNDFKINSVFKNGNLVVKNNKLLTNPNKSDINNTNIKNSINIPSLDANSFNINITNKSVLNVMEIIPNKLETNHLSIDIVDDFKKQIDNSIFFNQSIDCDLLKIAVIERHKNTGNIGLGVIKGLNIKFGAVATTIAHDSHNMIVAGCNDEDMIYACKELKNINGGIIIVNDGKILASLSLEIGGLMTKRNHVDVVHELSNLDKALKIIAPNINYNLFLTLSFLSLPVIPSLKITDRGIFDVCKFKFIDIAN